MTGTLGLHCSQEEMQQLPVLLKAQLEDHKATMIALLNESNRLASERAGETLERIEGLVLQHRSEMIEHSEAMVLKLQRAELSLDESLARFDQQKSSLTVLGGGKSPASSVAYGAPASWDMDELIEGLAAKLEVRDEERQQAMRQHLEELQNALRSQSLGPVARFGNGAPKYRSVREGDRSPRFDDASGAIGTFSDELGAKDSASAEHGEMAREKVSISPPRNSPRNHHAVEQSRASELTTHSTSERGLARMFSIASARSQRHFSGYQAVLDLVSAALIMLNCAWMGIEVDLSNQAAKEGVDSPQWLTWIEVVFAGLFVAEIVGRAYLQGAYFFRRPNLRMNLFDTAVVCFQVIDVTFTFYNTGFLRSVRVLRLFNAARIIRSVDNVRQLRLLVSALSGSMMSLFWVLVLVFFVLYLCALFVMQTIQAHIRSSASLDPSLMKYYGSVPDCMLSLFMAITGGAPWESLLQPLADISVMFVVVYVLFLIFVVCGLMNIITAIFVESTKVLAQKDNQMHVQDIMTSKNSAVAKIRDVLQDVDATNTGMVTGEQVETELRNPVFKKRLKSVGMEVWEARGLFQLLDTDALGQVSIEEFLHGIVRLKCKDQSIDLTTVMYENKRILTRLLAFMRFAEDHFRDMEGLLGLQASGGSGGKRAAGLETYLRDANKSAPEKFMVAGALGRRSH